MNTLIKYQGKNNQVGNTRKKSLISLPGKRIAPYCLLHGLLYRLVVYLPHTICSWWPLKDHSLDVVERLCATSRSQWTWEWCNLEFYTPDRVTNGGKVESKVSRLKPKNKSTQQQSRRMKKNGCFTMAAKADKGWSGIETSICLGFTCHWIKVSLLWSIMWLLMCNSIFTLKKDKHRFLPSIESPNVISEWWWGQVLVMTRSS